MWIFSIILINYVHEVEYLVDMRADGVSSFEQLVAEQLDKPHWFVNERLELINAQETAHAEGDLPIVRVEPYAAVLQNTINPQQVPVDR